MGAEPQRRQLCRPPHRAGGATDERIAQSSLLRRRSDLPLAAAPKRPLNAFASLLIALGIDPRG